MREENLPRTGPSKSAKEGVQLNKLKVNKHLICGVNEGKKDEK